MADNTPVSPAVPLFQKAHARMVTLQRVDEQIVALLQQRQRLQEELHQVQAQINEEFERVTKIDEEAPATIISQITDIVRGSSTGPRQMEHQEQGA
jgi:hypothetical protein